MGVNGGRAMRVAGRAEIVGRNMKKCLECFVAEEALIE